MRIGANNASIFINLTPVFTALIAVTLLHETLHSYHIVGGILVLLGVVMAQHMRTPRAQHNAVCAPDSDTSRSQIHEVEANRK